MVLFSLLFVFVKFEMICFLCDLKCFWILIKYNIFALGGVENCSILATKPKHNVKTDGRFGLNFLRNIITFWVYSRWGGSSMCSTQVELSKISGTGSLQTTPLFSILQARYNICFLSSKMCLRQYFVLGIARSPHLNPPSEYEHLLAWLCEPLTDMDDERLWWWMPLIAALRSSFAFMCIISSTPNRLRYLFRARCRGVGLGWVSDELIIVGVGKGVPPEAAAATWAAFSAAAVLAAGKGCECLKLLYLIHFIMWRKRN